YKSPVYEAMGFNLLKQRLIQIGYPEAIMGFEYDPSFPVRGLWFDKTYGNLLKVDSYGNILVCVHGFKFLKPHEVAELYPNKYIQFDDSRLYILNTLFNIPETYMLACVIDFFANHSDFSHSKTGVSSGTIHMSYKSIFQDIRGATDWLHMQGDLKACTMENLERYVHKDEKLPILLDRIRQFGAKAVLITNSGYEYTDKIMEYLLDFPKEVIYRVPTGSGNREKVGNFVMGRELGKKIRQFGAKAVLITNSGYEYTDKIMEYLLDFPKEQGERHWTSYWDCVVVDAKKPLFFEDGTILRRVDTVTKGLSLGHHMGPIKKGEIYSGGSCEVLSRILGAKGSDVLYVGDHIFGDILKSKKIRGWRTFLVVPELTTELQVWTDKKQLFENLTRIEVTLSDIYRHLDSSTTVRPDTGNINNALRSVVHELDMSYGKLGSLFRSGSRQTFFASQVRRYADIYAASILNLLYYPFCYMFRAPAMLMPHEATVDHSAPLAADADGGTATGSQYLQPLVNRSRSSSDTSLNSAAMPVKAGEASDTQAITITTTDATLSTEGLPVKRPRVVEVSVPHAWAETPKNVVHIHDDGDCDEDRSESPNSNNSNSSGLEEEKWPVQP
ncbi:cytosolic purine 5'-nucleotidase, partial [Plakobranchus ocellatus]